jgi:Pyruvate/2-oxoacid:ferredoxin oxidoreductase delta subunit
MSVRVAFYEGDGAAPLDAGKRTVIFKALLDKGYPVSYNGPDIDGAVKLSFRAVEGLDATAVIQLVEHARESAASAVPQWKPWFPVIDYSRCTNCMQCLSFCLFEVYGVSKQGKIQVQNQTNCKTECPACSRVCPEVAILFPKYRHSPINGDEVNTDDMRREAMKVDISALLGGDIYAMLRDRSAKSKSRFSKERDEERALKERQTCLANFQKDADIPMEVLAALPSASEILEKAQAASMRAQEALANNRDKETNES